jgi:HlyD family secretion protein
MKQTSKGFAGAKWIIALILFGAVAGGGFPLWKKWSAPSVDLRSSPRCRVQRGDLVVSILQAGELEAKRNVIIRNDMERETKIINIVEDGGMVRKGDLLIELDSRDLQDNVLTAKADFSQQQAELLRSQKEVEIADQKFSTDKQTAELAVQIAKLELQKYMEAEYNQIGKKAEQAIMLAEKELKQAEEKYRWSVKLVEKGYASRQELDANKLEVDRRDIDLKNSQADLKILKEYTYLKESSTLKNKLTQAETTLSGLQEIYAAQHARDLANVEASKSKLEASRLRLKQIELMIAKSKVYADFEGLVFYPIPDRHDRVMIEKGASVYPRQTLLQFPDLSSWNIKTSVPESIIERIRPGQKAIVSIDALPGTLIDAVVQKIALAPDRSRWETTGKSYQVDLDIPTTPTAKLKPGMSAMVEIITAELQDTMYAPIQAVTGEAGKQIVYLITGPNSFEKVQVAAGQNNDEYIQILSGLKEGQELLLYAPPAAAKRTGIQDRPLDKRREQEKNGATGGRE